MCIKHGTVRHGTISLKGLLPQFDWLNQSKYSSGAAAPLRPTYYPRSPRCRLSNKCDAPISRRGFATNTSEGSRKWIFLRFISFPASSWYIYQFAKHIDPADERTARWQASKNEEEEQEEDSLSLYRSKRRALISSGLLICSRHVYILLSKAISVAWIRSSILVYAPREVWAGGRASGQNPVATSLGLVKHIYAFTFSGPQVLSVQMCRQSPHGDVQSLRI